MFYLLFEPMCKIILPGTVRGKEGEADEKEMARQQHQLLRVKMAAKDPRRWKTIVRLSSEVSQRPHGHVIGRVEWRGNRLNCDLKYS